MTPEQINLVFGRGRLKMATGEHVEVFREAVASGERRRYTKQFLDTGDADFGQWTEREWRILARLIGHGIHCVPDVVQFDGGAMGGMRLVQTYDAGVTVDQWATLLPVSRNGVLRRHVFEECAHWWALAHYCLAALDEIHALQLVHLDIKGDNICIPYGPPNFDPESEDLRVHPVFEKLALIDFAFSLVSRENLAAPLPIGWQKDYDYQSPRLLKALEAGRNGDLEPTRDLDWRCDLYSLAAMLKRYLPDRDHACSGEEAWTPEAYEGARALIFRLRECHDRDFSHWRPHQQLLEITAARLEASDLAASLACGWTLAPQAANTAPATPITPITPITRIAPSIRAPEPLRIVAPAGPTAVTAVDRAVRAPTARRSLWKPRFLVPALGALAALAVPAFVGDPMYPVADRARAALDAIRSMLDGAAHEPTVAQSSTTDAAQPAEPAAAPRPAGEAMKPAEASATPAVKEDAARRQPDAAAPVTAAKQRPPPQAAASHRKPVVAANRQPPLPQASQPSQAKAKGPAASHPIPSLADIEALPKQQNGPASTPATAAHRSNSRQTQIPRPQPQAAPVQLASAGLATPAEHATQTVATTKEEARSVPTAEKPEAKAPAANQPGGNQPSAAHEERRVPATTTSRPSHAAPEPQDDPIAALWKMLTGGFTQLPSPIEERRAPSSERAAAVPTPPRTQTANNDPRIQQSPVVNPLPPAAVPTPATAEPRLRLANQSQDGYATQGRRVLTDIVPRIAARAEPDVTRVLWIADSAYQPSQERSVVAGISLTWASENLLLPPGINLAPVLARRLHDDARQAFASGRDPSDAANLELQAFGADPRDPDIAGYLAFLHLKANPAQAERARQLALYAIALSASRRPTRPDDWNTLAIASALTGREADATRALFVAIALTKDAGRSCRAALGVYTGFGEQLRGPAEAALYRIHAQGRGYDSPYCAWPPNWGAGTRVPERLSLGERAG